MPPPSRRYTPAAVILTAGILAATAILAGAVHDATPSPARPLSGDLGPIPVAPDEPAPLDTTTP